MKKAPIIISIVILGLCLIYGAIYFLRIGWVGWISEKHWIEYPKYFVFYIWPLITLTGGIGLLLFKHWGRLLALFFLISKLISAIWNIGVGFYWLIQHLEIDYYKVFLAPVIMVTIYIPYIFLLTHPKVKEQFKK